MHCSAIKYYFLGLKLLCCYFNRTALDTNLKIEREWRTSLQEESIKDKERIGAMQMELQQLQKLKKVHSLFSLVKVYA